MDSGEGSEERQLEEYSDKTCQGPHRGRIVVGEERVLIQEIIRRQDKKQTQLCEVSVADREL